MLDGRGQHPQTSLAQKVVTSYGRFFPNGANAAVAADYPDSTEAGWTIARTGVGAYTLTFLDGRVPKIIGVRITLVKATPDAAFTYCVLAATASTGVVTFALFSAGAAVDYAAAAGTYLMIEVDVRNTGVNP